MHSCFPSYRSSDLKLVTWIENIEKDNCTVSCTGLPYSTVGHVAHLSTILLRCAMCSIALHKHIIHQQMTVNDQK